MRTGINTDQAPATFGPYSPGVRKGNIVQVSGQLGFAPVTFALAKDDVAEQTAQAMRNITTVLAAAGSSLDDVIMLRVYLTDLEHFPGMNQALEQFLAEPFPARTTVFVGLPPGLLVEIDALAVLGD